MSKTYIVDGMTCGGCASSVKQAIGKAIPGATVEVDLATKAVTLSPAPTTDDDAKVRQAVEAAGFGYQGVRA